MPNEPEKPGKESAVDSGTADTADKLMNAMKDAPEGQEVVVASVKINARESYEKFKQALALVKQHIGRAVDIDLSKIEFQKLEGNLVGESIERATLLDPEIFRHPVFVIAQIVAHELLHKNTRIPNEGLVQAAVEMVFGKHPDIEHSYSELVSNFGKFAVMFDENGNKEAGIEAIYRLYDAEDYEGIFERFKNGFKRNKILSDEDQDKAFDFFHQVFPELECDGQKPGYESVKMMVDEYAATEAEESNTPPGEI
ncbi:MAG: hypothetical protein O3B47_01775 [bacterium]|nr:hypothetical protein [bacterium]